MHVELVEERRAKEPDWPIPGGGLGMCVEPVLAHLPRAGGNLIHVVMSRQDEGLLRPSAPDNVEVQVWHVVVEAKLTHPFSAVGQKGVQNLPLAPYFRVGKVNVWALCLCSLRGLHHGGVVLCATWPAVTNGSKERSHMLRRPGDQLGAGIHVGLAGCRLASLHGLGIAELQAHRLAAGDRDAVETQAPVPYADGGVLYGVWGLRLAEAQDTAGAVLVDTHGKALDLGLFQEATRLVSKLPVEPALLVVFKGRLRVRDTEPQNAFEGPAEVQAPARHEQEAILHVGLQLPNSVLPLSLPSWPRRTAKDAERFVPRKQRSPLLQEPLPWQAQDWTTRRLLPVSATTPSFWPGVPTNDCRKASTSTATTK
eukprot:CAMPEP_0179053386 /NCGR_PEP_ID=MMETSP0796-20121207/22245_1 /TAXON_ID=73915 /ORGANISM="Pyrodinium bahamense, Strain pbaha01" /LENGTH=367 /DNA_ID=CAMNT_0020749979 /DNA_START=298 /DNA_END=1398 /DNA_ORIENTATION=+